MLGFSKLDIYSYMIVILSLYIVLSAFFTNFGFSFFGFQLLVVLAVSIAIDVLIKFFKFRKIVISKSTIITALFITIILTPAQNILIPLTASAIAIVSKNFIKIKGRTVLNPASVGIVASALLLGAGISWWGTTPLGFASIAESDSQVFTISLLFTFAAGIFINYKQKRLRLAFTFLFAYLLIFLVYAIASGNGISAINIPFLDPILLFFAFFMLVEPKTSPVFGKSRLVYGSLVALLAVLFALFVPGSDVLFSLLIVNAFVPLLNRYVR